MAVKKIFIDGKEGTTGLRIFDRLSARDDIELITLPEEKRKDIDCRRQALNSCDIAFLCLPDAAAIEAVSLVENENVRIIDTSTAHRTNPDWTYGFPELDESFRTSLRTSKRVAVPGCHASGFIALVYPLVRNGIIPDDALLTCHSVTGYSGGGKKMIAEYESSGRAVLLDAPRQYALAQQHKHLREMSAITGLKNHPVFCPIVSDYYSGMCVTVPLFKANLAEGKTFEDVRNCYSSLYKNEFVRFGGEIGEGGFIAANTLSGKDYMQIFVEGNDDRALLIARFDNLGKGASGAAIECLNIMLGTEECTGLDL